jgi:apolipoprotein N-acyltransferase
MLNKLYCWFLAAVTGIAGGLMLMAGHFNEKLSILQCIAFIPLLLLLSKRPKFILTVIAGIFTGLATALPQVITLCIPAWMAAVLTAEISFFLIILCLLACWTLKKPTLLGCFVFGAGWFLIDWLNYTLIPIWGMAQSFARCWTAYPQLIAFISWTGISGILFVIGSLQALLVRLCTIKQNRFHALLSLGAVVLVIAVLDILPRLQKPTGTLRIATAGWTSQHSLGGFYDPDQKKDEFNKLFAEPAAQAAAQGAKIFASGEMAFDIDNNYWDPWIAKFAEVTRKNNLYLIVGYNSSQKGNCLFFMNPQGEIIADYLKTYLSPPEWGCKHGNGDLKTIEVDGVKVGAMICHDDNFVRMTRYYGRIKTPLIFSPCWDWPEVKYAHLAAVRARAIECNYTIARSAYHGIAAIISPHGEILARRDTFTEGPGFVIADVPLYQNVTFFARFGHTPMIVLVIGILLSFTVFQRRAPNFAATANTKVERRLTSK